MVGLTAFSKLGDLRHSFKAAPRGQGVTEYLITYSWALAIIGLIIVGLFYSGVFGTPSTPGACVAVQGYICANPVYTGNGITFTFGQNTGNGYYYGDWVFVSSDSAPVNSSQMPVELLKGMEPAATSSGNVMTPGQTIEVNFTNLQYGNITQNPSVGTALHGYVWFGFCTSEPCSEPKQIVRVASISAEASKSGTINPYGNLCSVSGNTLVCELNNQTITCSLTLQNEISGCSVPSPTTTTVTTTVYGGPTTNIEILSTGQSGVPVNISHITYYTNSTIGLPYPSNTALPLNYSKDVYGFFGGSRANFSNTTGTTCTLNGNGTVTITSGCVIKLNYQEQYLLQFEEQLGSNAPVNATAYGPLSTPNGKTYEWVKPDTNVSFYAGAYAGYKFTGFTGAYGNYYSGNDTYDPGSYSTGPTWNEQDVYGSGISGSSRPSNYLPNGPGPESGGCCPYYEGAWYNSGVPAHVNMTSAILEIAQYQPTNDYLNAGVYDVQVSYDYQNCSSAYTNNNQNGNPSNDREQWYQPCQPIQSGTFTVPVTLSQPLAYWSSGFGNIGLYTYSNTYTYYEDCYDCYWYATAEYSASYSAKPNVGPFGLVPGYSSINPQIAGYISNHTPSVGGHNSGVYTSYSYNFLNITTTYGNPEPNSNATVGQYDSYYDSSGCCSYVQYWWYNDYYYGGADYGLDYINGPGSGTLYGNT